MINTTRGCFVVSLSLLFIQRAAISQENVRPQTSITSEKSPLASNVLPSMQRLDFSDGKLYSSYAFNFAMAVGGIEGEQLPERMPMFLGQVWVSNPGFARWPPPT